MSDIVAIYGSPRRDGNTASLLKKAVSGARDAGATVKEFFLRDLKISPCLEIYGCKKQGKCVIQDDFQMVIGEILTSHGLIIASPIFFYAVSAHTKALMDRCQSLWVKKHWIDKIPSSSQNYLRRGIFISAGATQGKKLFDGAILSMRYFMETLDMKLEKSLCYRGIDLRGDIFNHQDYLDEAYETGNHFVEILFEDKQSDSLMQ
ncbi:MAG: flavodoxin family protein [Desulfobia sp.]